MRTGHLPDAPLPPHPRARRLFLNRRVGNKVSKATIGERDHLIMIVRRRLYGGPPRLKRVFVPIIVLMVLAVGLNWLIGARERRIAPWQAEIAGRDQN